MAILSKTVAGADINQRQLTITDTFRNEPFPSEKTGGAMNVKEEHGLVYNFEYKVKSRNKRILSGSNWLQFIANNGVRVGDRVLIDYNDGWFPKADYKIEVIRGGF
ncbi:hypothetical protein PTKIN_Ptkin02bG0241600 [Pterospermum kingtungense]